MRKLFSLLLMSAALSACVDSDPLAIDSTAPSFIRPQAAVEYAGFIRVGVVPSASSVTIGSAGDFEIRAKGGAVLYTGSNGAAVVTLESATETRWRLQVMCASAAAVAARKAAAEALGHPTMTEEIPACTRLLIGSFPLSATFTQRNNYRNLLISQGLAAGDSFWRQIGVSTSGYRIALPNGTSLLSPLPPVLTSATDRVTIAGVTYRGAAEVGKNSAGTLAGINQLPIEPYLYGVVPKELGPIQYPQVEAIKAQAVAARTYALSRLGARASDGYDVLATTADQAYGGVAVEHPVSTAAVEETRGVAITYNGALISALYSSATGGHSANSEESFANAIPYLRGVPDAQRGEALEHVPSLDVFKFHRNPRSLRAAREGDFESNWSSRHSWTFEWDADEISAVLSAWRGTNVGKVHAINVLERGPSGRVLLIEYVTDAGTFTHAKDGIRSSLRYLTANGTMTNLPSTLFFIEPAKGKKDEDINFVVYGAGFGHGVGMGQTGAVGMAEKGATFDEILKHYYTGVDLTQKY